MQHAAGFIRLPYLLEKGERKYQRNLYLIIRLKLENYWQKKWVYFLTWEKPYLTDIVEDNYNIVRDRFETDLVNVMKNWPLVAKKHKENFNIY